jgi:predicted RNase H-like nuclease (RuvC/YqgF family)
MFDPLSNKANKKKTTKPNLLEIEKDSSSGSSSLGEKFPQSRVLFEQKRALEKKFKKEFLYQAQRIRSEEKEIFNQEKEKLKEQIQNLKIEIQAMADSTQELETEVKKAALVEPREVSTYQVNFLERLKNFIKNFRKNLDEATEWLETFNQRSSKRFWGRVKKGGSTYLLSGEHSASRSAA